jgi:lipid-A-disaccharide synthase
MKYFLIAGERSGDMHGSRLLREIRKNDSKAEIVAIGGDYVQEYADSLLMHYKEFSFMGIIEVLANLGKVRKTIRKIKALIKAHQPDVLLLVDFPGINLKMATYAKELGIKTCYYISPKIWAWKEHRIKRIKRDIDKMLVILPFEEGYYKKHNYEVDYIGNPLVDAIKEYDFDNSFQLDEVKVNIAVLPGSRKQEIVNSSAVINQIAKNNPTYNFLIAGVNNVDRQLYDRFEKLENIELYIDKTYDILKHCNAAIVTSGTATLETALLNCPQVVVYKANALSVFIARLLVKIKWISLVNLIAHKEVVKELIQEAYSATNVMKEISKIINDHGYCASMLSEYQELKNSIGTIPASKRASEAVVEWLRSGSS